MKTKQFEFGAVCDIGKIRDINQDNILIKIGEDKFGEFGLFLIADGVGSLAYSQLAGELIVDEFRLWWNERLIRFVNGVSDEETLGDELEKLIMGIHRKVNEKARKFPMGSTLSVLFIYNGSYIIRHIGDSRIYLFREQLEPLTVDHTFVEEQLRKGFITLEEAINHPQKNVLTQCLGANNQLTPYANIGGLEDEDIFLVCSDGLYNMISEEEISEKLKSMKTSKASSENIVDEMLKSVMKNGALDNVSIIVVKYTNAKL